nr:flagellar basal body P-ring formation chaperone FlgA [Pseudooceanicola onchidii]
MIRLIAFLTCLAAPVAADTVVATRTIRPQSILTAADLAVQDSDFPGGFTGPDALIGQETRVVLYAGRPVLPEDIGPPALVERNQIVTLAYARSGLNIRLEGRSLARAGVGEKVRVMNLQSRATLTGRVQDDGTVVVE